VRRFRWLVLQIGAAALLLTTLYGTFWASALAVAPQQTEPSASGGIGLPVPATNSIIRPNVSPPPFTTTIVEVSSAPTEAIPSAENAPVTATNEITATTVPTYYVVQRGDTLFVIATDHGTTVEAIMAANGLNNANVIDVGQVLLIPGSDGGLLDPALLPVVMADGTLTETVIVPRGTITERMTSLAQQASVTSPYYNTTWLTYYGRPNIDVMGILGEYSIEELVPLLRAEADAYERANGDGLKVVPAFHLVYGMATKAAGEDNSHLAYIGETEVISYIEAAAAQGWGVILDVQIGALTPTEAISPALEYLKYPNVHLAIDPEFAMSHAGQTWPGNPIGFVTAEQVNEVQAFVDKYIAEQKLSSPRILLVHQFQDTMIVDKEKLDQSSYPHVALTLSVDGWGGPWGKISKYNSLVTRESPYVAFKLFYRWDEPLLLPDEALGNRPYRGSDFFMDVTPNLIIYQ
jgi:LysM repeat protein